METEFSGNVYEESLSASSSEDGFSTDSDDSVELTNYERLRTKRTAADTGGPAVEMHAGPSNLQLKLFNRERKGVQIPQRAFNKVPNRLGFCLKDIVPHCFLQGHMFMGLSACGQFLLSYKVCCNDNVAANHYSFNIGYKYTLYFWIYQPHKPLRSFYKCCLFDDHGVDSLKDVTMTQWKCSDPRVLIVHGAAEDENEDSYITYVKVPKLGCLDCKKLRDMDDDGLFRWYALCLKCNLTIHTKYSSTESDRKFNPYTNLICPDRILIVANGFMHMLHIELDLPAASSCSNNHLMAASTNPLSCMLLPPRPTPPYEPQETIIGSCDNHNNIVARIIADFSDIETDSVHSNGSRHNDATHSRTVIPHNEIGSPGVCVARKTYDELIFTCNGSAANNSTGNNGMSVGGSGTSGATNNSKGGSTKVSLVSHQGRRHHRIVTKSYRNGVTTVDMQGSSSSTVADKSNAYEFSEDNEKCEKIATLRKRRLADKKYEFSEDNSENIIPFNKSRSASKLNASASTSFFSASSSGGHVVRNLHRTSGACPSPAHYFHNSPNASPSSSPHPSHASSPRASPITAALHQVGFRSPPCSSPVSAAGIMRSPSRHVTTVQMYSQKSPPPQVPPSLSLATQQMLSYKPLGALSPLQVSLTKRSHMDLSGSMSPNANVPFLSPRREELRVPELREVPLQGGGIPEKPVCTKKFKRRYVEEDDAASVITSEEDDCISPGYHTSLPMEVHGSCYADMQMISQASYQQLRCASVIVTQHSFDLEAFTYYIISTLCQKNHKTYDVFYDWACEIISVCPLSRTIICLLMAQFSARDQLPAAPTNCLNCSRKLDCAFHRRQCECRILFTWNMESGEWEVLDYGELLECKKSDLISPIKRCGVSVVSLAQTAKKLAHEMANSLSKIQDYSCNLRVLDSNVKKSKTSLTDHDNMIEFYLKRPRNSE